MTNPCEIGFKCPHCSVSDEGDDICIHPYTVKDCPDDELFGMIEETICPKCGKEMILCEDEKTYYQIWECDGCGYKEVSEW